MPKISDIQDKARSIAEQVANVYMRHTGENFIELIVHGSAIKGGFILGSSDMDFNLI